MKFTKFLTQSIRDISATLSPQNKPKYERQKGFAVVFRNKTTAKTTYIIATGDEAVAITLKNDKLIDRHFFDEEGWEENSSDEINEYLTDLES